MYRFYHLIILILPLSAACFSQPAEIFPAITKEDLPDADFQPARLFTGTSLFGYIDGGAELYLEYGFVGAWVSDIAIKGAKYKTEIYKMAGPEEAFGIFSVSKYRCRNRPPLSLYTCQTRYQLQVCSGPYYISIINGSGKERDSIASLRIGEAIVNKIKQPSADLSSYFPGAESETIKERAVLAKGRLGIVNGASEWEDYFKGATGFTAVILPGSEETLLAVKFNTHADYSVFLSMHNWQPENISALPSKFPGGEVVRRVSDDQLLIEIIK